MKKVNVLSIAIGDEYPAFILASVHTIIMPDDFEKDLVHSAGFPSLPDYLHWDHILTEIETNQPFCDVKYDVSSQVSILYEELKANSFQYDPDVIAAGDYSRIDLVANYAISKMCKAFSCVFVHNSRA